MKEKTVNELVEDLLVTVQRLERVSTARIGGLCCSAMTAAVKQLTNICQSVYVHDETSTYQKRVEVYRQGIHREVEQEKRARCQDA